MTFEEKRRLSQGLGSLPGDKLGLVMEIIAESQNLGEVHPLFLSVFDNLTSPCHNYLQAIFLALRNSSFFCDLAPRQDQEVEVDIDDLSQETLWRLNALVTDLSIGRLPDAGGAQPPEDGQNTGRPNHQVKQCLGHILILWYMVIAPVHYGSHHAERQDPSHNVNPLREALLCHGVKATEVYP